jgi:hypothetical protein
MTRRMNNKISGTSIFLLALFSINCGSAANRTPNGDPTTSGSKTVTDSTASLKPCVAPSLDASRLLVISAPCGGDQVSPRHFVEGIVSVPNANVWVIIHPMEVTDYWVQPSVTVREGGRWKVLCYFGEPGQPHSGKHYQVIAVTNPKEKLKEGQLYPNWPESESRSQVVEVIRQ